VLHALRKPTPVFDAVTPFWMFTVFLQNFGLAWNGEWGWTTVTMTWSLALEEQFYLTVPAALRILGKRTIGFAALALILLAPVARYILPAQPHSIGTILLTFLRADALGTGLLCAMVSNLLSNRVIALIGVGSAAVVVLSHQPRSPVPFLSETSLLGLYSSVLLFAYLNRNRRSLAILRSRPLVFFGAISYALYITHQTMLVTLHSLVLHSTPSFGTPKAMMTTLLAAVASAVLCKVSWEYFENPLTLWARRQFKYAG
jgi:peptidoglycan/LPS O-acetylase OafA/YrhL